MTASLDFQPPPDGDSETGTAQGSDRAPTTRRMWPVAFALVLSVLWLGAAGYVAWRDGLLSGASPVSLVDLATLIEGLLLPIAIAWLAALVFQRTDPLLERRLGVAKTLDRALAPIDHAERRLDQLVRKIAHDMDHVEAAVDLAASRIDNLEGRFRKEIAELFSATADAEAKATTIKDMLKREHAALSEIDTALESRLGAIEAAVTRFTDRIKEAAEDAESKALSALDGIEQQALALRQAAQAAANEIEAAEALLGERLALLDGTSQEVAERLDEVATGLRAAIEDLSEKMSTLEALDESLGGRLAERHHRLAALAQSSEEEARRIEAALAQNSAALKKEAEGALAKSDAAAEALEAQAGRMADLIGETLERAEKTFARIGEDLARTAETATSVSTTRAEEVLARVNEAVAAFEAQLQAFDAKATEAGTRLMERLTAYREGFAGEAETLEKRAAEGVAELERLAQLLADQAEMVAAAAGEAARNMGEAGERMDERSANLGQVLDEMRRRIEEVGGRLEAERKALAEASETSAGTVLEAAERFRSQSDTLSRQADAVSERLLENTEALDAEIARIDERGRGTVEALDAAVTRLRDEGKDLMEVLERSSESLGQAATAFGGERERILADTNTAAERLSEAAEVVAEKAATMRQAGDSTRTEIDTVAQHFAHAAERLKDATEAAKRSVTESSEDFENRLASAIAKGLREVGQSMDTLNSMFGAEVSELEDRITRTLESTVAALREAASEAGAESERMAARLAEQSDKLVHRATSFLNKSEEIERRILANSRDAFVRTSSLLIESLQSAAVDIDKILETEVPDDVWQRYLAGDRSIFSRRTVRLADRKTRGRIRDMFEHDREFRDTVLKYFRDFEALMEQVMSRDTHSTLSVTLISSEMGKLYVLLAQSLKKLR